MDITSPITIGVIPARIGSTRFPRKPLVSIHGKPLIQWTYERAMACTALDLVIIATDDNEIRKCGESFGAEVHMTRKDHATGTDRVAEVASSFPSARHILNIQGDEPLIDSNLIDTLAASLVANPEYDIVTAANEIREEEELTNPNYVKVVLAQNQTALYFTRSKVPYRRAQDASIPNYRHKGIYGFQKRSLERLIQLPQGKLERLEQLEQLRALENGMQIHVTITEDVSIGLDTPEQLPLIKKLLLQFL